MVSTATIPPHIALARPHLGSVGAVQRANVPLTSSTSDVLRIFDGPCVILAMWLEITEAVEDVLCNMRWVVDSDQGGDRIIGDDVNIQAAALGDFYFAELDGTAIVKATTSTGLIHDGFNAYQQTLTGAVSVGGFGVIVPPGGIDIVLSATPATGKGTLYVYYKPLISGACIVPENMT